MPPEPKAELDLRRVRFAAVIDRAIRAAQARGLTIGDIERLTGVGNTTFYGWRTGKWVRDPVPAKVRDFFEGLDMSIEEPYRALGWTVPSTTKRVPEPIIQDPEVRALMRKLVDPNVSTERKNLIRRVIRGLLDETDFK